MQFSQVYERLDVTCELFGESEYNRYDHPFYLKHIETDQCSTFNEFFSIFSIFSIFSTYSTFSTFSTFPNSMIPSVVDELKQKQLLTEDLNEKNGLIAQVAWVRDAINIPLFLVKSDGGYGYDR